MHYLNHAQPDCAFAIHYPLMGNVYVWTKEVSWGSSKADRALLEGCHTMDKALYLIQVMISCWTATQMQILLASGDMSIHKIHIVIAVALDTSLRYVDAQWYGQVNYKQRLLCQQWNQSMWHWHWAPLVKNYPKYWSCARTQQILWPTGKRQGSLSWSYTWRQHWITTFGSARTSSNDSLFQTLCNQVPLVLCEQLGPWGAVLTKTETNEQLGDIFTKGLGRVPFEYLQEKLIGL